MLRHSSVRVPHKDHQSRKRTRKVQKNKEEQSSPKKEESIRPRTVELPVPEAGGSLPPRPGRGLTTVDGDGDDEHPHARQRMHVQKIITSRVDKGLIENPSCKSTRLTVLGQLACTNVNVGAQLS